LKHIQQVLGTLRENKLYANLDKCSFDMQRIKYLGYIIDKQGVHVDPTNIQVIHDLLVSKGVANHVSHYLSRPTVVVLTAIINSCGHDTSKWPQLYNKDSKSTTYDTLSVGKLVPYFHL